MHRPLPIRIRNAILRFDGQHLPTNGSTHEKIADLNVIFITFAVL
jgi:hypothetical protein